VEPEVTDVVSVPDVEPEVTDVVGVPDEEPEVTDVVGVPDEEPEVTDDDNDCDDDMYDPFLKVREYLNTHFIHSRLI
jgi:hypothetical protein